MKLGAIDVVTKERMRFSILFLVSIFGMKVSAAFVECDRNSKPERISGKFMITKVEDAKLTCEWDTLNHKVDPPASFDAKGCYMDLEIVGPKNILREYKFKSRVIKVYAYGPLCNRKANEKVDLHLMGHQCCGGKALVDCEKKGEKMKLVAQGDPNSPKDMVCLSGRFSVEGLDYP